MILQVLLKEVNNLRFSKTALHFSSHPSQFYSNNFSHSYSKYSTISLLEINVILPYLLLNRHGLVVKQFLFFHQNLIIYYKQPMPWYPYHLD